MRTAGGVTETKLRLMQKQAERIEEIHQALVREIIALKDHIKRLDLEWDGSSNSAFMTAMEADLTEMYLLVSLIWDAGKLLERAECTYQESEREVRGLIDTVKTRGICG